MNQVPLFGPIPGGMEMMVILLIAVLLFGANKIPKLARSTGEAMGQFKKGRQEVEQELQEAREGASTDDAATVESDETDSDERVTDRDEELDDENRSDR